MFSAKIIIFALSIYNILVVSPSSASACTAFDPPGEGANSSSKTTLTPGEVEQLMKAKGPNGARAETESYSMLRDFMDERGYLKFRLSATSPNVEPHKKSVPLITFAEALEKNAYTFLSNYFSVVTTATGKAAVADITDQSGATVAQFVVSFEDNRGTPKVTTLKVQSVKAAPPALNPENMLMQLTDADLTRIGVFEGEYSSLQSALLSLGRRGRMTEQDLTTMVALKQAGKTEGPIDFTVLVSKASLKHLHDEFPTHFNGDIKDIERLMEAIKFRATPSTSQSANYVSVEVRVNTFDELSRFLEGMSSGTISPAVLIRRE